MWSSQLALCAAVCSLASAGSLHAVGTDRGCVTADCHPELALKARPHLPLTDENCAACHVWDEASTPYKEGPDHRFTYVADTPRLCNACHSQYTDQRYVHEPVLTGACTICHDPHAADYRNLLRVEPEAGVCTQCHQDHYTQGRNVHQPVALGRCSICHDPHQSPHKYRLRAAGIELCGTCHEPIRQETAAKTGGHHADIAECWLCHDAHNSDNDYLLVQERVALCLDCHAPLRRELADMPFTHKPIEEGRCRDCHRSHGGAYRALLVDAFTERDRTAFAYSTYAFCFDCHEATLVTTPLVTAATQWRDGLTNLHYVHVAQDDVGQSCSLCHPPHASREPKLVGHTIAFGDWSFPLSFAKSDGGGSCSAGCHQMRTYVRADAPEGSAP